jgi:hypothetical protein
MTPQQLAEIKRLAGKATPGPWFVHDEFGLCRGDSTNEKKSWPIDCHETDLYIAAANPEAILKLIDSYEKMVKCVEFYGSEEAMSCRLRCKSEYSPKCLTGDSDYFQDPADLPILQDGGKLARETLKEVGHE